MVDPSAAAPAHLSVQPDGSAHRCILEYPMRMNPVGNILDPDFQLFAGDRRPCHEHWRCPGCDRDKVAVRFGGRADRKTLGLPLIEV